MGRLGRAAARLLPAGRREWVEAVWAEADELPPGLRRLAWRAGAVRLVAREAVTACGIGRSLLFAAAATMAAWAAWPGSRGGFPTVVARMDVVTIVLVLAGLPWVARGFLGPAGPSRLARFLRVAGYAAVLALIVAKASVLRVGNGPTGPALQFAWFTEIVFLVVMGAYVAALLAVTAQRPRLAPATLAIGTGAGIGLGAVMYAVAPLGLSKNATEPWLAGSAVDPVVALAWILLLGGPAMAGFAAARRYRGTGSQKELADASVWHGGAAGLLAAGAGGLIVTVLGTGTVALMPRAAWLRHWLYPGHPLLAAAAHRHELAAAGSVGGYGLILLAFPVIGCGLGVFGAVCTLAESGSGQSGPPRGGGGAPDPGLTPDPLDGGVSL